MRFKDRFIFFGRTSTYGLRNWEQDRPEVKGGTIRSMVEQLLRESEAPLHVDELANAIRPFRPTTSAVSIRLNLQLTSGRPFVLFSGGYVGLVGKTYEHIPQPMKRVPGSLMRRSAMRKFIGQPVERIIEHLSVNCDAGMDQIKRTVQSAIDEGRLVVNQAGLLESVPQTIPPADGPKPMNGELPLDW